MLYGPRNIQTWPTYHQNQNPSPKPKPSPRALPPLTKSKPEPREPATSPAAAADGLRLHFGRRRAAVAHGAAHPPRRIPRVALARGAARAPPPRPPRPRLALARRVRRRALPSRGAGPDLLWPLHASARRDLTCCGVSPVQVGSDVAFLAETAAAVASCPDADDALRGVCHLVMVPCFGSVETTLWTVPMFSL